jgi:hypothetical protein
MVRSEFWRRELFSRRSSDTRKMSEGLVQVDSSVMRKPAKKFPLSVKKGKLRFKDDNETSSLCGIPDGMIRHPAKE